MPFSRVFIENKIRKEDVAGFIYFIGLNNMRKRLSIILFCITSIVFHLHAYADVVDGEIMVDGTKRTFHFFKPLKQIDAAMLPLVMVLHGGGSDGQSMMRFSRFNDLASDENFIAVYPDGYNRSWNDGRPELNNHLDDVKFISMLIDYLISKHGADPNKVFITGISNGAIFSLYLAAKIPGKIRAVAAVCGSIPQFNPKEYALSIPLSVMVINGTEDPLLKYNGGSITVGKNNRGSIMATDSMISFYRRYMQCNITPEETKLANINLKDHSFATKLVYKSCTDKKEIILIKVEHGGHTWPGGFQYLPKSIVGNVCRDFNATAEIWDFFKEQ
jgi:polyhydroxybutyrate depolymerase